MLVGAVGTTRAEPPLELELDAQKLAGDLLLVPGAAYEELRPLAQPARDAVDFLAARATPSRLTYRGLRDRGALYWTALDADEPDEVYRLPPPLAGLVHGLADLERRTEQAGRDPVTTAELAGALRTHPKAVQTVMERVMSGPSLGSAASGGPSWFEPGGLLLLQGSDDGASRPLLVQVSDAVHALARELLGLPPDPDRIRALVAKYPLAFLALDDRGLLAAFLERSRGKTMTPRLERQARLVLATVTENAASSYMFERAALLALLAGSGLPEGRLVGLWHGHPGDPGGDIPSEADLQVAQASRRFVTIVLRRDGYDLYDLRADRPASRAELAPDLRARPDGWEKAFERALTTGKTMRTREWVPTRGPIKSH
jgi:hypothetical protein